MSLEGHGGRTPIGPRLYTVPSSLAFGSVEETTYMEMNITLRNSGDETCDVYSVSSSDSHFTRQGAAPPYVIDPGDSQVVKIRFTPGGVGSFTGVLTISSDAINSPTKRNMSGIGVVGGSKEISVDPSSWEFPETKVTLPSTEKLLTIKNTGTVDVTLTGITYNGDFSAGATVIAFPYVLGAGLTVQFGVKITPSVTGYILTTNGAVIASDAVGNPHNLALSGFGILILTAFTVTGTEGAPLLAFSNGTTVVMKQFDPNDLDCEEDGFVKRKHDFGLPGYEKKLTRMRLRYEDLGVSILTVRGTTHRQTESNTLTVGTVAADEKVRNAFADLVVAADIIELEISREADDGPLSLTQYAPFYEPGGEIIAST